MFTGSAAADARLLSAATEARAFRISPMSELVISNSLLMEETRGWYGRFRRSEEGERVSYFFAIFGADAELDAEEVFEIKESRKVM